MRTALMIFGAAQLVCGLAFLVYAIRCKLQPQMTDKQWRCFMDAQASAVVRAHHCIRCAPSIAKPFTVIEEGWHKSNLKDPPTTPRPPPPKSQVAPR